MNSDTFWPPPEGSSSSPLIIDAYTLVKNVFWRLATMLRWVLTAPLGRPVVPLV